MKELSSLGGGTTKKPAAKPALKNASKAGSRYDLRPLYAFISALVLYVITLLLCNKYPLGEYSFLQSDLKAQYAPFLALLRSKIAEFSTIPHDHWLSYLSYSFKLGLGKNFIGTFGYYLASPFNLLYLLFEEAQIDFAVIVIVVLKLSLSSSFMCLFLGQRSDNRKTLWPVMMGIAYAFSLYSQAFIFQIMWLDGYMLLPLILYFTERFIKEQKYAGLVISLLVLFVSNYYIAYMAGLACFLYLCIRMAVEKLPVKKALGIVIRYVLAAGFTALITAAMLVPVGLDTIRNADQTVSSRGDNVLTYTPLTLIHMFVLGEAKDFSDVLAGNYPFLFIGLFVTLLLLIYFISPVFKGRERNIHAFCMLGVLISTAFYPVDKAWQVFDDPNWFWHRHAFVFLPLFIVISMRVLLKLKELARKDILKAMLIMYVMVIIDCSFGGLQEQPKATLYNLAIITVYAGLIAGFGVENWPDQLRDMPKLLSPIMTGIMVFELVFIGPMFTSGIETLALFGGAAEEYSDSIRATSQFGKMAEVLSPGKDNMGFRAETEHIPEYTDKYYVEEGEAFYGNYNGLSFFNSNSNKKMQRFMKQLGIPTNYNYFSVNHTFACPSIDTFFSIGAVSSRRDISFYNLQGEDSYASGLKFYNNPKVLPLGFAASKSAGDFDFYRLERDADEKNYFEFQNEWYHSLFTQSFNEPFFIEIIPEVTGEPKITNGISFNRSDYLTNSDVILKQAEDSEAAQGSVEDPFGLEHTVYGRLQENITTLYRENKNIPIAIEYEFKAPDENEIYCSLVTGRIADGTEIYVNGIRIYDFASNAYYSQIFRIGKFNKGENVKVTFLSDKDSWSYLNIRFASFDTDSFWRSYADVHIGTVYLDEVYDGYARFDIRNIGADEMVITTIPAEDGWQLYIDGAPCDHEVYQDAFIAFDPGSGNHTAELVFTAPGTKGGIAVSCAGIVLLAAFIFIDKKRSKMKEKQ